MIGWAQSDIPHPLGPRRGDFLEVFYSRLEPIRREMIAHMTDLFKRIILSKAEDLAVDKNDC